MTYMKKVDRNNYVIDVEKVVSNDELREMPQDSEPQVQGDILLFCLTN